MRKIILIVGILLAAALAAAFFVRSNTARLISASLGLRERTAISQNVFDACPSGYGALPRRICADKTIASLNTLMTETLTYNAEMLSLAGRALMARDHQAWLTAESIACDLAAPSSQDQTACVAGAFRDKLRSAKSMIWRNGQYTIQRRQLNAARRLDGAGRSARYVMDRVDYPRIDNGGAAGDAFNLALDPLAVRKDDLAQEFRTYNIAFAGSRLISIRFDSSTWPVGAEEPAVATTAVNMMMPEGRRLRAEDIFVMGSNWRQLLARKIATILCAKRGKCAPLSPRNLQALTTPTAWIIEQDGITVIAEALCERCAVNFAWEELSGVLRPDAAPPMRPQVRLAKPA